MRNWIYYRGSEYRFHPSYGWVKRESNDSFDEVIKILKIDINNQKMKEINLIDGIPSTEIQSLEESIRNILNGLHNHNTSRIYNIINEDIEIKITKNKLIEELFLAFKYTLVNNRYGDLLSDNEMKNSVIDYVDKYILIKK